MNTWLGRAAVAAIVVFGAANAEAQITTVMDPPKRVDAKQQLAAKQEKVAQDSIARVTMTGMKEWVDSAANALAVRPDTNAVAANDSGATATQQQAPQRTDSVAKTPSRATAPTEFRDRARAPDTATPVPTVAFVGAVMLLLGVAMRRRRPGEARARAER
jgi:MYXO-CTERM domain-containing protein